MNIDTAPPQVSDHEESIGLRHCMTCGSLGYRDDRYCACCGSQLVRCCRFCNAPVLHPVAHYCTQCGGCLAEESVEFVAHRAQIHNSGPPLW